MANNGGTLTDEDEDTPDWIEIHHRGEENISLENYSLTDDPGNLRKWQFPGIVLEPDGRLLVYASGKDRRSPLEFLHTNFSLDADGEYLALVDPEGTVVSAFDPYPPQEEDESYGLSAPRRPVTVIDTGSPCRWLVPFGSAEDLAWTAPAFDDGNWLNGRAGLGYDFGLDFHQWILTDVSFEMAGFATSAQIRFPFEVAAPESLSGLILHLHFDDGFVAFLNGERVAEAAAPDALRSDSRATSERDPSEAVEAMEIDLSASLDLLQAGTNMLAIQGLDASPTTGDFLIHPELEIILPVEAPDYGLMAWPTPGAANRESYAGRVSEVVFEQTSRFLDAPTSMNLITATPGALIYYTLNGSAPSPETGFAYEGSFEIGETLAVRARAFREDLLPSRITTRTYVFVEELAAQSLLNQSIVEPDREAVEKNLATALPLVSIAVDRDAMFGDGGLDTIPEQTREVPVSMEFFSHTDAGFQVDAGLGIHGGNARTHPKKPFRLFFRRDYGRARLDYPLFEEGPVSSFDQLILRAGGHDSWSISRSFGSTTFDLPAHATYLRDQFLRETELDMGALSPRGRYVHLLLNGFYWGIYDLHERPNADFFSDHLGGNKSDWDVLHHTDRVDRDWAVIDGSDDVWRTLHQSLDRGIDTMEDYAALQTHVDLDSLIDSLVIRMWSGDYDWAGPLFWLGDEAHFFRNKNWYAGRRGGSEPGLFQFFAWDAEMSMGSNLLSNVYGQPMEQRVLDFDLTAVNDPGTPTAFHGALRFLPDYQRRFGDRVQKHLVEPGGVLTVPVAQARLDVMREILDPVMVGESARWGDLHSLSSPFTREGNWRPEVTWLREAFIPQRRDILIEQLRARGLYPSLDAPLMTPLGGSLDTLEAIELSSPGETIYYTTDGSDPASSAGFQRRVLLDESSPAHYLVPSIQNGGSTLADAWKAVETPPFFDSWTPGEAGVGFDATDLFYPAHFQTDVSEMSGVNTTLYLRLSFDLPSPDAVDRLILRVKYDDGFAAFLNGEPLASASAPEELTWFSQALFRRPDEDAVLYRDYDVSHAKPLLRAGNNVLAIQALNGDIRSSDLLLSPQLIALEVDDPSPPSANAEVYTTPLTFTDATVLKARIRDDSGEWSPLTEAYFYSGHLPDATSLRISEIHYHPLASEEYESHAFEFIEITNTGSENVQLEGLRFSEGVDFTFASLLLDPGESVIVANNREAFLSRYDDSLADRIVGEFGENSRLSNGGEILTLVDREGVLLDRVAYDDQSPWAEVADGGGPSLERLDFGIESGGFASWGASIDPGGSPGVHEPEWNYSAWQLRHFTEIDAGSPMADPDGDGHVNLLEYWAGSDPNQPDGGAELEIVVGPENASTLIYRRLAAAEDVAVTIEGSADLALWSPQPASVVEETLANGISQVRATVTSPATRWYRLKLSLEE